MSLPVAFAAQISETPDWVSLRLTSDHVRPPPETVARCAAAPPGPSCDTKATISSPAVVVVSAGAVSVPLARRLTDASIEIVAGGGALLSTVTSTGAESAWLPAASNASAVIVWRPAVAVRVSHVVANGGAVTGVPSGLPSTANWTLVTPRLSAAVAPRRTMPPILAPASGSVMLTVGASVSGGGGEPASTSTAARFHWSAVGAVSEMGTTDPAAPEGVVRRCTQYVSPVPASTHWCSSDWPAPSVREIARSQSLPTPNTQEPAAVVVTPAVGGPDAALAPVDAPTPAAPVKAMTSSDWSKPPDDCVAVNVAPDSAAGATACQISASPARAVGAAHGRPLQPAAGDRERLAHGAVRGGERQKELARAGRRERRRGLGPVTVLADARVDGEGPTRRRVGVGDDH